jgi:uncharacterized protein YjbI with pentapeptide repeats
MDQKEMDKILSRHEEWRRSGADGKRAVLIDTDLRGLDLRAADLRNADLRHVEAWRANLKGSRIDPGELHKLHGCEAP